MSETPAAWTAPGRVRHSITPTTTAKSAIPKFGTVFVKPGGIGYFLVWYFYLKKSKRVKATFGSATVNRRINALFGYPR